MRLERLRQRHRLRHPALQQVLLDAALLGGDRVALLLESCPGARLLPRAGMHRVDPLVPRERGLLDPLEPVLVEIEPPRPESQILAERSQRPVELGDPLVDRSQPGRRLEGALDGLGIEARELDDRGVRLRGAQPLQLRRGLRPLLPRTTDALHESHALAGVGPGRGGAGDRLAHASHLLGPRRSLPREQRFDRLLEPGQLALAPGQLVERLSIGVDPRMQLADPVLRRQQLGRGVQPPPRLGLPLDPLPSAQQAIGGPAPLVPSPGQTLAEVVGQRAHVPGRAQALQRAPATGQQRE